MSTVQQLGGGSISVTTEVVVTVSRKYHMSPTEGYAGIASGSVIVIDILDVNSEDIDNNDLVSTFTDGHLSLFEGGELDEQRTWLLGQPWVVYTYTSGDEVNETYALPAELFVRHSVSHY